MQRMGTLSTPILLLARKPNGVSLRAATPGIPVFTVSVVMPADLQIYLALTALAEDTHQLISFGATVFDTKQQQNAIDVGPKIDN